MFDLTALPPNPSPDATRLESDTTGAAPTDGRRHARGFAVLTGGTATAQAIALLTTVVVARLYDPGEVGGLAVVISLVGLLTPLVTLTLYEAVVPATTDGEAYRLVLATLLCTAVGSVAMALAIPLFLVWAPDDWQWASAHFLWAAPLMLAISGAFSVLLQVSLRAREYGGVARRAVIQNVGIAAGQIGLSRLSPAGIGLILGEIVGRLVGLISLLPSAFRLRYTARSSPMVLRDALKANRGVISHYLPAMAAEAAAVQLPLLLVAVWFGDVAAGYMGLAYRVLVAPISLLGAAAGQVILAEVSHSLRSSGSAGEFPLFRALKWLTLAATAFAVTVMVLAPTMFGLVFGPEWIPAGELARALAIPLGLGLVWNPLSRIFVSHRRWGEFLAISALRLLAVVVAGATAWRLGFGYVTVTVAMAAATALVQLGGTYRALTIARESSTGPGAPAP